MALYDNSHKPNGDLRQRVTDLSQAGIPKYLIAKIIELDEDTLTKYYSKELETAIPEAVGRIAKVVAIQAMEGCPKSQALYLKTQGAKYGFVEKQVIETVEAVCEPCMCHVWAVRTTCTRR